MKSFFWQTIGSGSKNIIFLHGWGFNAQIWSGIIPYYSDNFKLHIVDLPGYGKNRNFFKYSLKDIIDIISYHSPNQSILIGWSLGGLIATKAIIQNPEKFHGLIVICSSPCFCEKKSWPGIKIKILNNFALQLKDNFKNTMNRFFSIQLLGAKKQIRNIRKLKDNFFDQPEPSFRTLISGLKILKNTDLRYSLKHLKIPILKIYGSLDVLIPKKSIPIIKKLYQTNNFDFIIPEASHAPFISHPKLFFQIIKKFLKNINF
ncbi:MAG: pimeloyl-ACP methyl ester esterase BioH [Wigglesworthia glossinidia]|nr:pimeloyl-ACP methyl ester esterase BioH [Wigglesworthia glossinidia]